MNSSVASSARSDVPNRTGVECVWNPEIVLGLPAWPTTSTAYITVKICNNATIYCWLTCPTLTVTGKLSSSSLSVMSNRGYIAGARKYNIQWYLSSITIFMSGWVQHGIKMLGSHPFASVNARIVDNKLATAVRLMIWRSWKKGLIVIVPLPICTKPCAIRTMKRQSGSL